MKQSNQKWPPGWKNSPENFSSIHLGTKDESEGSVNHGRHDRRPGAALVTDNADGGTFVLNLIFPIFDDSVDVLGWLKWWEHSFHHQWTAEEDRVGLASFHLDGDAQFWFLKSERDWSDLVWQQFKHYCNTHFGPPFCSNKLGKLSKMHHISTMEDYQWQFE